jgi:DNA-binding transcriptional MerR regulator
MADDEDGLKLSITELSEQSGFPVTTLRLYQHRQLLPPPERSGRRGYYNAGHLERLGVISELQRRGYSLAAIADVVDRSNRAATLLDEAVPALAPEAPLTLSLADLARRLPTANFSFEMVQRAATLELLEVGPDGITIRQPRFLDVGITLVEGGVPGDEVLDAYERLRAQIDEIASQFIGLYDQYLATTDDETDPAQAAQQLETLAQAGIDVVVSELRRALRRAAAERLRSAPL